MRDGMLWLPAWTAVNLRPMTTRWARSGRILGLKDMRRVRGVNLRNYTALASVEGARMRPSVHSHRPFFDETADLLESLDTSAWDGRKSGGEDRAHRRLPCFVLSSVKVARWHSAFTEYP
eukprot:1334775-Amorphochlora_amoeboformis.AAC.2